MKPVAQPRSRLFALCLFVAAAVCAQADEHQDDAQSGIAELTSLLRDFLANSGSAEAHARFWADELVYTSSNGTRFGKAEIMQGFDMAEDDASAEPAVVYSGEDVKVQLYGATAVVTFRLVGTGEDGAPSSQYFNTGTFLKRNGEWRAVAWQATIIPATSN